MGHIVRGVQCSLAAVLFLLGSTSLLGQQPSPDRTTADDHRNMMAQLGIRTLRPGPSGNEPAPNHANYDEAQANPFPNLPDVLTLESGKKVTTADMWWQERRPEIVELFEREVLGRVPHDVPKVTWSVVSATVGTIGQHKVIGRQIVGHVESTSYPSVAVDIQLALVMPGVTEPIPVVIMFSNGMLPQSLGGPAPARGRGGPPPVPGSDPPAIEQLIAAGWGVASISPTSIQADNGAGLTNPVDAHQLIALCAPRPTFISYGVPEKGDARWLDHQGSYMAAVAAGLVFRLLGAKDLGTSDDYKTEKMPAVNVSMPDGQLAWRQHDGGHTDGPNWKYFIPWADTQLARSRR
jgi:hypothetical protein